jgi:hypothetical protein
VTRETPNHCGFSELSDPEVLPGLLSNISRHGNPFYGPLSPKSPLALLAFRVMTPQILLWEAFHTFKLSKAFSDKAYVCCCHNSGTSGSGSSFQLLQESGRSWWWQGALAGCKELFLSSPLAAVSYHVLPQTETPTQAPDTSSKCDPASSGTSFGVFGGNNMVIFSLVLLVLPVKWHIFHYQSKAQLLFGFFPIKFGN